MVITETAINGWMSQAFWPFLRLTGVFLTSPFFGNTMIPPAVRVGLCAIITAGLAAWLPPLPPMPSTMGGIFLLGGVQILCGAVLGLLSQMVVAAVAGAGEMAGFALGTSFATLTLITTDSSPPVLYDIFYWAGLLVYIAVGGPIWLMSGVAQSFTALPSGVLPGWGLHQVFAFAGQMLEISVILALPALAASLALNAAVGLANTLAPQLNIFSIGFPLLLLGGLWIVSMTLTDITPALRHLMLSAASLTSELIHQSRSHG
jgi:flagellar biosynthetic protein FliR